MNSYLFIGFDKIKNIVFQFISLKRSWEPTNKTQISQNISIIAKPKSTTILDEFHIEKFQSNHQKISKIKAKRRIKYKNLFLTISLNVLIAILNITKLIII